MITGRGVMIVLETIRKIRVKHRNGNSIRKISRDLRMSRTTVRKFINMETINEPPHYKRAVSHSPQSGDYLEKLKALVVKNINARKKREKRALYEDLKQEGFKGSYATACRQINKIECCEKEIMPSLKNAYVPLHFEPGEAYQFDWSDEKVEIGGTIVNVKMAHVILCQSGQEFVWIYENERQEMVLDAHVRAFEFFGGVPRRGIYDNMKTAVQKILIGTDRKWNPRFERMCAHYRVEPTACTPAAGWEKGRVERRIQLDQKRHLTPMLRGEDISDINAQLQSHIITYSKNTPHATLKEKTIEEVFQLEKPVLTPLPIKFDTGICKEVRISKTCLAMVDRNHYSVDCHYASKIVQCRSYADRLIFTYNGRHVGEHLRRFTRGETYYNWYHYLSILSRKPGALRNGAPFMGMQLPDNLTAIRDHFESQKGGPRVVAKLLSHIPQTSLDAVEDACKKAIIANTLNYDVIINYLFRGNDTQPPTDLIVPEHLKPKIGPEVNCIRYDQLLKGVIAS